MHNSFFTCIGIKELKEKEAWKLQILISFIRYPTQIPKDKTWFPSRKLYTVALYPPSGDIRQSALVVSDSNWVLFSQERFLLSYNDFMQDQ